MIICIPADLKEPQEASKSPFCGLWSPLGLTVSIPQLPACTCAQEALGGSRDPMQPFVIWGLAATLGLYLGRGQVPAAPASANLWGFYHPQHGRHLADAGWPVFPSHPACKRFLCEMVSRSGSPVLGGKALVPEVGVGLLEAPGASSGLTWSPLLLFWQQCNGRGKYEALLDSPAVPR